MSKLDDNKDGGPAFPVHPDIQLAEDDLYSGMSLRDWFAGRAIGAVVSATSAGQHNPRERIAGDTLEDKMAADAYEIADAMLKVRQR